MKNKKGILRKIFCCFFSDDSFEDRPRQQTEQVNHLKTSVVKPTPDDDEGNKGKVAQVEKVTGMYNIDSVFIKENLLSSTSYSKATPFNCPICLMYFNNVLKTSCCENQICRNCLEDIIEAEIKSDRNPKCQFCQCDKPITYSDIKENDKVSI